MFSKLIRSRWCLAALWLGPLVACSAMMGADKGSKIKFDLSHYMPQIVRGQSGEIKAFGKNLNLQSVEISPPEGISIQKIVEIAADPEDKRQVEKGVRVWSIKLGAENSAAPGERSLTLVTPVGRSDPRTFKVTTHLPVISDLKVLSASADGVLEIELSVFDEAADITPENAPSETYVLRCGNNVIGSFGGGPARLTMKDPQHALLYDRHSFSQPGQTLTIRGICTLKYSLSDKPGNNSNELTTAVEFKP